ncbi:phosphotransferase enzyme family protein [Apiospora phragmitis]|uniref:Phosphotransferase enzyme family protein n=1 Tax=Apiospora phragmitis TaxID=2905665 RepID=A0ABR1WVZ4_9PEZI
MAPQSPQSADQPFFNTSALPDISSAEIDFPDTSFFHSPPSCPPQLPAPSTILEQRPDAGSQAVVKYEDLNLVVKFGTPTCVRLEEAQIMRAVRGAFPNNEVPVPKVFGWRQFGGKNFIYVSLVAGKTLREAWPVLTEVDKKSIQDDLRRIIVTLRQVTHGLLDPFIGKLKHPLMGHFTKLPLPL